MSEQLVRHEREGAVAVVTFDRADKANAWTPQLGQQYFRALEQASDDPETRAVVVTGAGRHFCAGVDFAALAGGPGAGDEPRLPMTYPTTVPKPVIAAVNGACIGIGMVQALYCDLRVAAADATFTTGFTARGLPADYGAAWLLPRLIGTSRALDLLLSSRRVETDEAHQLGLVDRVVDPDALRDTAVALAAALAESSSPRAMALAKRQVWRGLHTDFDQSAAEAEALLREAVRAPDMLEGIAAFREQRAPRFPPLEDLESAVPGYEDAGVPGRAPVGDATDKDVD